MSLKFFSFSKESTNYTNFTNGGRERFAYDSSSRLTTVVKIRVISVIRGGRRFTRMRVRKTASSTPTGVDACEILSVFTNSFDYNRLINRNEGFPKVSFVNDEKLSPIHVFGIEKTIAV